MKRTALLFPGQGSQYVGMGKDLYENYHTAREVFEEAGDILKMDVKRLCFEGSMEELTMTENTQPAILTVSMAAYRVLCEEMELHPVYGAGHSLGEISALTCAGAIDFADALKLVRMRGRFMQEASGIGNSKMLSIIGSNKDEIAEVCRRECKENELVAISNYNAPTQTVISGHRSAVDRVKDIFELRGAKVIELKVSAPFHSLLMQPAAGQFCEELKKYTYHTLKWPVLSNVNALPYESEQSIIQNLTQQITKPVRWTDTVEYLESMGVDTVIEVGPKKVLTSLISKITPEIVAYPFEKTEDIAAVKVAYEERKKESSKDGKKLMDLIGRSMGIAVCIRNRNFDEVEYKAGVIEPYRKIKNMYEELEKQGMEPTIEQAKQAIDMLDSVFATKKVPNEERVERFKQLFRETKSLYLFPDFTMPQCDNVDNNED